MRGPTKIINAFHPDFVKTHMPQFLSEVKTDAKRISAGQTLSKFVTKKRESVPMHGFVHGLAKFPPTRESQASLRRGADMPIEEIAKELTAKQKAALAPKEFHMFSKAGTANTTKEKK